MKTKGVVMTLRSTAGSRLMGLFAILWCLFPCRAQCQPQNTELLIGIEPEHNIFDQMERYRTLADYLSDQIGVKVRLTIMSRYGEVMERYKTLGLDGAFLNSYTAALAIRELNLSPVARPVQTNGSSVSRGYIFVRRDSGIKTVADMRNRSFVFVDPAATEGYLYPVALLREQGMTSLASYFNRYYFAGSNTSTIFAVLDGRADIGATKDAVFNKQIAKDPTIAGELGILHRSPAFPETTLCVKNDLPPQLRQRLLAVLLAMDASAAGGEVLARIEATRFSPAVEADYDIVLQLARDAGIAQDGPVNTR